MIGINWVRFSLHAVTRLIAGWSTSKLTDQQLFLTMDCGGAFFSLMALGMPVPAFDSRPALH